MCASVINQINTECVSSSNKNKTVINTARCDVMDNSNNNSHMLASRRCHRRRYEFTATTRSAAHSTLPSSPSRSASLLLLPLLLIAASVLLCAPKPANAVATMASANNKGARESSSNSSVYEKAANVTAAETTTTTSVFRNTKCFVIIDGVQGMREVGTVWVSSNDSCAVHTCEFDASGVPQEVVTKVDCGQFYCDMDSEVRPQPGSCCGECVRTKCRFNDTVYDVGQMWHSADGCTMYECAPLSGATDVTPLINVFEKTCPPLPLDCPREQVYVKDCCMQCRDSNGNMERSSSNSDSMRAERAEVWNEEFYRNHPCVRECQPHAAPMTCSYTFVIEWYQTISKACYKCPQNTTDCERPHCVLADGVERSVIVVNRMMPGPAIEVCEGDTIVVDVTNKLLGDSTTIHWHGIHQRDSPYMDGTPHITQCPISPHSTFRYRFRADNTGTHFWHSHTGMQRGDGVFGALIIRQPRASDPHGQLYDFDLSEHKMILQDWVHEAGASIFVGHHHSRADNKPVNLLVNGRGRFYYGIWKEIKEAARTDLAAEQSMKDVRSKLKTTALPTTTPKPMTTPTVTTPASDVVNQPSIDFPKYQIDQLQPSNNSGLNIMRLRESNEILRLARVAPEERPQLINNSEVRSSVDTSADSSDARRAKRAVGEIPLEKMPLQTYHVRHGFRYRFRIINAEFLNCPIAVSIDNHTLTVISSDGYEIEPLEVGSLVTYAGERFDFVLNANQSIGNYWIRFKGLMDCSEEFTSAFQVGILRYEGATNDEPNGVLGWAHKAEGIELNAMNRGSGYADSLTAAEMTALPIYNSTPGVDRDALKTVPDYKFFIYYDFYAKDNPDFHPVDYYAFNKTMGANNRVYTPQLNHISLEFPPISLLAGRNDVDDSLFCNETSLQQQGIDCREEFCQCYHVLQVPLNSVVELILVDEGFTYDANHPFHLHGNAFRVVALERLGVNVTVEMVKQLDRYNLIKRNLDNPPVKDTVTVPDGGYTILRFEAYNPGFWLFHCHIEFHAEIGMALIFKVGDNDQMVSAPKNFPTCHNFMNSDADDPMDDNITATNNNTTESFTTTTPFTGSSAALSARWYSLLFGLLMWGSSCFGLFSAAVGIH
ncbi:uncharacterized protein LOC128862702 [Anastrepha ludens]|uniref:uncharacterized protein LOC128862702 n=1 Tax=Anastrepha ludens TaxID=28586 RepID=UPI0023B04D7E|nr:uncharacterized protein LOC128862702 [Anastrepha ludens]